MAGWIGPILAVRLLGRASIYLMTPASQAFQLAWTNRTMSLAPGQMGQPLRGPHPHSRVSGEAVGAKCGPARRFPRAEAGGHRGQCRCPRHRFAYVLRRSWLGWSFTPMSRGVRIASMCWSTGHWSGLSGTVCRLNSSAAGAWTRRCYSDATQHDRGPRKLGSDQTVDRLALPVRPPAGQRELVMCGISEYPSHPNCWYSPVGWVYSPHSNVI